jgi:cytochrome c oxidase cbb3-type subunit 2
MKVSSLLRFIALPTLAAISLFGAGMSFDGARQSAPKTHPSVYDALAKVPPKARMKRNPIAGDPDAIAAGRKLFEEHCAQCHEMNASGGPRGPSLRTPQVERATPGTLFWILSNGVIRHGMPDWSKLPEPERWQIVTFLKSPKRPTSH